MTKTKNTSAAYAFYKALKSCGWNFKKAARFKLDYDKYVSQQIDPEFSLDISQFWPLLSDCSSDAGDLTQHYSHQDLYVAQRIFSINPDRHVDVGSSINGFVSHVASFRKIEVLDIRPLSYSLNNVSFKQADIMDEASITSELNSTDSLSCLHTLEHFGLGRYGDSINPMGHIIGARNLSRIIKPKGRLYLSVPIGKPRVAFNAHRILSIDYVLRMFGDDFCLSNFSYEDDTMNFHPEVDLANLAAIDALNMNFGCGIFEFIKKQ